MPECAKTHLQQQSRVSKFSGEDPRTPRFKGRGGNGKGGEEGREKGSIGREGREGKGHGRKGGEVGALDMDSSLETSSGSAPVGCSS